VVKNSSKEFIKGQIFSQGTNSLQTHGILIPNLEGVIFNYFWSQLPPSELQISYEFVAKTLNQAYDKLKAMTNLLQI
jgi:hypothetical protein